MPPVRPTVTPHAAQTRDGFESFGTFSNHVLGAHFPQSAKQRIRWLPRLVALCETLALPLAVILTVALFYGARQPVAVGLFEAPWDKLAHTALFAALAGLIAASRPSRYASPGWLALSALAATAVGGADELHQMFLPGRSAGLDDFAANTVGAFLGVAAWSTLGHAALAWAEKRHNC